MAQDQKRNFKGGNKGGNREMQNRPFQQLRGMKVGPSCLCCGKPITRVRDQRQGYFHDACEAKSSIYDEKGQLKGAPLYVQPVEEGSEDLVLVRGEAAPKAAVASA